MAAATLPKSERLCGKKPVAELMDHGRGGVCGCFRYRFLVHPSGEGEPEGVSRILVSVPKRNFKRAVKRNLLKRRIREAYRLQKQLLPAGVDLMFVYLPREVLSYADIHDQVTAVLAAVAAKAEEGR